MANEQSSCNLIQGRLGTPEEIAQVLSWIIKDSPEYLTGAPIPVSSDWEYL